MYPPYPPHVLPSILPRNTTPQYLHIPTYPLLTPAILTAHLSSGLPFLCKSAPPQTPSKYKLHTVDDWITYFKDLQYNGKVYRYLNYSDYSLEGQETIRNYLECIRLVQTLSKS